MNDYSALNDWEAVEEISKSFDIYVASEMSAEKFVSSVARILGRNTVSHQEAGPQ